MERPNYTEDYDKVIRKLYQAIIFLASFAVVMALGVLYYGLLGNPFANGQSPEKPLAEARPVETKANTPAEEEVVDGIHLATGLKVAEGFEVVRTNCTNCHSGKLIAQNRATREGWKEMIRWMQRTQGLWELGDKESTILDYLAAHYAPEEVGRRANLDVEAIEWYILEQ